MLQFRTGERIYWYCIDGLYYTLAALEMRPNNPTGIVQREPDAYLSLDCFYHEIYFLVFYE